MNDSKYFYLLLFSLIRTFATKIEKVLEEHAIKNTRSVTCDRYSETGEYLRDG